MLAVATPRMISLSTRCPRGGAVAMTRCRGGGAKYSGPGIASAAAGAGSSSPPAADLGRSVTWSEASDGGRRGHKLKSACGGTTGDGGEKGGERDDVWLVWLREVAIVAVLPCGGPLSSSCPLSSAEAPNEFEKLWLNEVVCSPSWSLRRMSGTGAE